MSVDLLILVLALSLCYVQGYQDSTSCATSSNQFYDILRLQCATCPTNTATAKDNSFCNCTNAYFQNPSVIGFNHSQSCLALNVRLHTYRPHIVLAPRWLQFIRLMARTIPKSSPAAMATPTPPTLAVSPADKTKSITPISLPAPAAATTTSWQANATPTLILPGFQLIPSLKSAITWHKSM